MKTALKWAMIAAGGLAALAILILLVLPFFFNAEKYKALLENKVSAMTGRSFSVGGDVALSFFPFVGASFSDLRLGNPTGFETTEFLSIKSFEVRVKLLPLLSRDVQVKRFVVDEPQIVLTKDANGRGNWQFDEKGAETEAAPSEPATPAQETAGELPIRSLAVADFSVSNGSIVWFDNATGERQAIDQLDVTLTDLSFDRPVGLSLSARKDDKPIAANGTVGPIGRNPQKAPIPLELKIEALSELAVTLNGTLASLAEAPRSDLAVTVSEFSPRKLLAKLGPPERIETADAGVLNKLSLKADVDAGPQAIIISNGTMMLDDSTMTFKARIADFSRPDIAFEADLDRIDLDRYRPPKSTETVHGAPEQPPRDLPAKDASQTNGRKGENNRDLAALRRLLLDAALTIGEMTVNKARLSNCRLQVRGQDGVFSAAPLQADLYGGRFNLNGEIAVSQDPARSKVAFQLEGVQAGPLLQDQLGKNILEGRATAAGRFSFSGNDAARVKKTLNGTGDLRFSDGAIKGIDLVAMIQNLRAAFGSGQVNLSGSQTEFTELAVPFTVRNGVLETRQTKLQSHILDALVVGKADLVSEKLDFRVEPKVVRKLGREEDAQRDYSKVTVPVLVSGTFSDPVFAPDLESVAKQQVQEKIIESKKVQEYIEKKGLKKYEQPVKDLLENFLK